MATGCEDWILCSSFTIGYKHYSNVSPKETLQVKYEIQFYIVIIKYSILSVNNFAGISIWPKTVGHSVPAINRSTSYLSKILRIKVEHQQILLCPNVCILLLIPKCLVKMLKSKFKHSFTFFNFIFYQFERVICKLIVIK